LKIPSSQVISNSLRGRKGDQSNIASNKTSYEGQLLTTPAAFTNVSDAEKETGLGISNQLPDPIKWCWGWGMGEKKIVTLQAGVYKF
jgi:hypothetical protein